MIFFRGDSGAPFAVVSPGGGFSYNGPVHEGFPYVIELQVVPSITPLPVNEKRLQEMEMDIDNYMSVHMPGEEGYKTFIRIVSVYLTFIARKPLHPPGMFDKNGQTYYKGGIVVCPLRPQEITKTGSLCRFCVSVI